MTVQSWLIYLTLVFIATSTPGPAVVFIMTNSTLHGWKKAVFAALGNIVGLLFLGIIAISGLGTILKTSVIVFSVLKYGKRKELIFIGVLIFVVNIILQGKSITFNYFLRDLLFVSSLFSVLVLYKLFIDNYLPL